VKRAFAALRSALAYFTILPLGPFASNVAPDPLAVSFLPFVGALVGAIAGIAAVAVAHYSNTWWPIAAWIVSIVLTGAIHIDGFLDSCDALFASAPAPRRLEILHDPRHGTFAVTGMAVLTVTWIAAIAHAPLAHIVVTLAFVAALARVAAIGNALVFPYGRPGAVTAAFVQRPNLAVMGCGLVLTCVLGWLIDPMVFAIVPASIALSLLIGWWASRRLGGGLTGDVFGAIIVVVEVLTLLAVGAL
jgi:adenosylcobinamide-GDP ribazoletransferase